MYLTIYSVDFDFSGTLKKAWFNTTFWQRKKPLDVATAQSRLSLEYLLLETRGFWKWFDF